MVVSIMLGISIRAIVIGTVGHFRILGELERARIPVKYFANITDFVRAYKTYGQLAQSKGWPFWPLYTMIAAYIGLLAIGAVLLFHPFLLERIAKWRFQ